MLSVFRAMRKGQMMPSVYAKRCSAKGQGNGR
jgi:hypothetical protein